MGEFFIRRMFWSVVTLFVISVITFWVLVIMPPGDTAQRFAGKNPTPEKIAQINEEFCLDKPAPVTYTCFMRMTLSGNFESPSAGDLNVIPLALQAIPVTLSLAVLAACIWLAVGVFAGAKGALAPGSRLDRSLMIVALAGISFPMAWLSLLSLKFFTDAIPLFPAGGYEPISEGGIFLWMWHLLLPAVTLSIVFSGVYARMTRSNVRQALQNEYVKTAIAKGLPGRQVFVQHVLRTGLIPIVVMLGMDFAALLGGAIFTETVFGLPGLGSFLMQGIATFDFAILFVGTLIAASFVVISTTIVDLLQAMIDPRIRLG